LETWHPDYSVGITAAALSKKIRKWQGLTILDFKQQGNEGVVEFEARFIDGEGKPGLHHEVSRFFRVKGKWLYLDGNQGAGIA
jgi:SEC-C motif-containing protein